jgi:predicted site-specific integrase-resolvase
MNDATYITGAKAAKILDITQQTLRSYADKGCIKYIRTVGGKRRYNVESYIRDHGNADSTTTQPIKKRILYARVSTRKQSSGLEHQIKFLRDRYPDFDVVTDIGSGINFKRRGFKRILELAVSGNLEVLAVAHKDRLCRIAFELVEWILQKHGCKTIVVQSESIQKGTEQEFVDDIISIIHSFSARTYGHRSYSSRKKNDDIQAESDNTHDKGIA